jgi:hypothetical protein
MAARLSPFFDEAVGRRIDRLFAASSTCCSAGGPTTSSLLSGRTLATIRRRLRDPFNRAAKYVLSSATSRLTGTTAIASMA